MPPVLQQKNERRSIDWTMRLPARVKSTEFSLPPQRAKAAEPAATEPAPRGRSGVEPDAQQPDGSRSLSARPIAKRTEIDNP